MLEQQGLVRALSVACGLGCGIHVLLLLMSCLGKEWLPSPPPLRYHWGLSLLCPSQPSSPLTLATLRPPCSGPCPSVELRCEASGAGAVPRFRRGQLWKTTQSPVQFHSTLSALFEE